MRRHFVIGALVIIALVSAASIAGYVHYVYLTNTQFLPDYYFWASAIALSTSVFAIWTLSSNEKLILSVILVSAIVIVNIFFLRFYFYGTDLVGEYFVAETTDLTGRWMPERSAGTAIKLDWFFQQRPETILHRYFSTTSVTIVPSIVSQVSGLSMRITFLILLSSVSVATVLVSYLIVKMCFSQKIAALSSMIFVFCTFFIGKFPAMLREDIALLFLLLAFYSILRGGEKYLILSVLSLGCIPMAHYGTFYISLVFVVMLFISEKAISFSVVAKILNRLNEKLSIQSDENLRLPSYLILYAAITGISWLLLVSNTIFAANMGGFANSLEALLGLRSTRLSYFQQHAIISSLGPFNTIVQWLERIFALAGLVLAIRMFRNRKGLLFILTGAGILGLAVALLVLPNMSLLFDLDRTMQVALMAFSFFVALTVFVISQKGRLGKVVSALIVAVVLLEALHTPILYSSAANLSREDYIFSFSRVMNFFTVSDFQFAAWADQSTDNASLFTSNVAGYGLCLIAQRNCAQPIGDNASDIIALIENGKTDYFLIIHYLNDYLSFSFDRGKSIEFNATEIGQLENSPWLDRIYDNSRVELFRIETGT